MKKKKKTASRILAAALSTAFTLSFAPVSVFAEQIPETEETVSTEENLWTEENNYESETEEFSESVPEIPEEENQLYEENTAEQEESIPQNYQVSISIPEEMQDVCFAALNEEYASLTVQDGETIHLKAKVSDKEEKHCLIRCIRAGSQILFEEENGQNFYENDIQITRDMADENGNINISVELMQYYLVQFSYNSQQGAVSADHAYTAFDESNPEKVIGTVQLNQDERTTVRAVPAEHYRVVSVKTDNHTSKYSENDCTAEIELEENKNHTVEVMFALNKYTITGNETNDGEIKFCIHNGKDNFSPESYSYGGETAYPKYGQTVVCCIKPNTNQYIHSVKINGELYQGNLIKDENSYYLINIENVTEDIQVDVDFTKSENIQLVLPETDEKYPCYNSDVVLHLVIEQSENAIDFSSGKYWIAGTEEQFPLDMNTKELFISKENNQKDIVVYAELFDKNGQSVTIKSESFSINSVKPRVEMTSDDKENENALEKYYNNDRTITVLIYDRADTLPSLETLAKQFVIKKDGQEFSEEEKAAIIQYNKENIETITINGVDYDRTVAELHFSEEGNYKWSFSYVNLAGMSNSRTIENGENLRDFVIDKTAPTGSVSVDEKKWYQSLWETLTFGLYSKNQFNVTVEQEDVNSNTIELYISHSKEQISWEELEKIETWEPYRENYEITSSDYYIVYARLTDKAGNRSYLSSKGLIIDEPQNGCTISFLDENGNPFDGNQLYTDDVKVQIKAQENGIFSGINHVEYWLEVNGEEKEHIPLYQFEKESPVYEELISEWSSEIVVPKQYSSLNTVLFVEVTDNAGNVTKANQNVSIDKDAPDILISYEDTDGNVVEPRNQSYFNHDIRAVIHVAEANFDKENFKIGVKLNGKALKEETEFSIIEEKHEGNLHEFRIPFSKEKQGKYEIFVSCTDKVEKHSETKSAFIMDSANPKGEVEIKGNSWGELLNHLTFGIFENEKLDVTITAEDGSGIERTEYFLRQIQQNEETLPMTKEELEQVVSWTEYDDKIQIQKNENDSNIVYVRITDNAGNVTYLSSDGYVYDDTSCEIYLTAVSAKDGQEKDIYREEDEKINVEIKVRDYFPYSGIKSIEYWTKVDDQRKEDTKTIYEAEIKTAETDKNKEYEEQAVTITIPINEDYNSSDIEIHVKATDFAGNVVKTKGFDKESDSDSAPEPLKLDIDITPPEINVVYKEENKGVKGQNPDYPELYVFNCERTAIITVTERREHVNTEILNQAALIAIQDIYRGEAEFSLSEPELKRTKDGTKANHDDDEYSVEITFSKEGTYSFSLFDYSDKAGNQANLKDDAVFDKNAKGIHEFSIDRTPPTGYITAISAEGRRQTWSDYAAEEYTEDTERINKYSRIWYDVVEPLHFGFWSKAGIQFQADYYDENFYGTKIQYYKSTSTNSLTIEELKNIKNWSEFNGLTISSNEYCVIYLKLTDPVGNTSYISTDALVVDDSAPYDEMNPPDISMTPEQEKSGIHNGDVAVSVMVDDPLVNDAYSGLKTISYRILNMGQETENGTLYTFDAVNPQHDDLLKTWEGEITVSSEQNNSNDVIVEIYALDNAGNGIIETLPLSIDATSPKLEVSFTDKKSPESQLFNRRTARISITERNFSKDYVNIQATRNGEEYQPTVVWSQTGGSGNGDNTVWYTDIPFSADGEYTFSVNCSDLAANKSNASENFTFTVDATDPEINILFQTEQDTLSSGKYYQGTRTASVTINELHFNQEKVNVSVKKDGTDFNMPIEWKETEGSTIHTAHLTFSEDARYSLNVNYTDEAGLSGTPHYVDAEENPVTDYNEFYIDTKNPEASVSVNDKKVFGAYADEVIPVISYQDTNLNEEQVEISLSCNYPENNEYANEVEISKPEIKDDTISFTLTSDFETKVWTGKLEDITDNENHKIPGKTITFEDFPSDPSNPEDKYFDNIYTISVSVKDKSDRVSENELTFSVNRFGSTYDVKEIQSLLGTYSQVAKEVVIYEINPNNLEDYVVTLFKNNEELILKEDADYDVIPDGGEQEWHRYTYRIHQSVFEDEGTYRIELYSKDRAGNESRNVKSEDKKSSISFIVDKNPPDISIINLQDGASPSVDDKFSVMMTATDNIKLSEVKVYLDGDKEENLYCQWEEEEIKNDFSSGEFTFDVDAEPIFAKPHQLKVVCIDASGRQSEKEIKNFRIIMNDSVKPLIYTGIGAGTAAVIVTAVLIIRRRKNSNA